jgi:1-acyl-sn-glycerol-3-phosphate acyltransferase
MYFILRKIVEIYIRGKFKIHVHNADKLPTPRIARKGGFIIACNHQLYYDPPAIAAMVKGKFSFMAKSELFEKKAFAFIIRIAGAFPVSRGVDGEQAMQRAFDDLKKGRIFVIFPEGTRSKDGTIGRGKSGVALIAAMAGAPVLPVCLMYGLDGNKKRMDFAVGDMIPADEVAIDVEKRDRRELKRVTERIMGAISQLQAQILGGIKQ